jgi:pilus assembly protein CpaB
MKRAHVAVLGIAILCGGAAYFMFAASPPPPAPASEAAPVQTMAMADVLVAAGDLAMGQGLKPGDLRWQPWPADMTPAGSVTRNASPGALDELAGAIVRYSFLAGEPIRREKLIKADGSGYMSAILPSGMRAVAISIDTRGATSAGGFILPNDRVDVLRTYRDDDASRPGGGEVHMTETILTNIRVLAIGQNVQERNGDKVVTGETATLELTPAQAEAVTLAQKVGQLSLALRSLADAHQVEEAREEKDNTFTVVRYGVPKPTVKR